MGLTNKEYEEIIKQAEIEASRLYQQAGINPSSFGDEIEKYEEFLFQIAREYIYGKVSLVTLSSICGDYEADFVCHAVSELGQRLVFLGTELEYYAYVGPDEASLEKTINEIKKLCIFYFGEL